MSLDHLMGAIGEEGRPLHLALGLQCRGREAWGTDKEWILESVCLLAAGRGGTGLPQVGWQLAVESGKETSAQLTPPQAHRCRPPCVLDCNLAVLHSQGATLVRDRQGHHQGPHKTRVAARRVSVLLEKAACRVDGGSPKRVGDGAAWRGSLGSMSRSTARTQHTTTTYTPYQLCSS